MKFVLTHPNKCSRKLSVYFRQHATQCQFSGKDSWVVLSEIEQRIKKKIEAVGTPLKDWDIHIYRGILTGYNEAFIINEKKKEELIAEDPKSAEIIRPILRGKDIKRYGYDFADRWLINTHNGIKEKGIKPVNINDYPAIKKHLDSFWKDIEKRADQGDTPYNLRNCAYMDDFSKQKIVWAELARTGNAFTLDNDGYYVGNTAYILVVNEKVNKDVFYKYLLAVLNSKAILFYLDIISTRLDETGWRWLRQYVELLPIPKLSIEKQKTIRLIVESELKIRTNKGQNNIDLFINEIYNFTDEEIQFLEKYK